MNFLEALMASRPLPAIPPTAPMVIPAVENAHNLIHIDESDPSCFVVLHDFDATDDSMLSIKKGELLLITSELNPDWTEAQNCRAEKGWVPSAYIVQNNSLNRHDWYHGKISRNRAEYLLSSGINGSFLIRESESNPGQYSLSVRYEGRVYHYRVNNDADGSLYVQEVTKFRSIPELVSYHNQEPGGLITCLRFAAPKLEKPTVYSMSPSCDQWEIPRQDINIGAKLGGGQYGEVYKAEYKRFNKTVAVKTLKVREMVPFCHLCIPLTMHLRCYNKPNSSCLHLSPPSIFAKSLATLVMIYATVEVQNFLPHLNNIV